MASGVDYDSRCKKWRARLTRKGCVYHLGHFDTEQDAIIARKDAEGLYNTGNRFSYLHSYPTSSAPIEIESDPYLYSISAFDPDYEGDPEKKLRLALFFQSVKDVLTDSNKDAQVNAWEWFNNEISDLEESFTFVGVCEIFNWDAECLRKALREACLNKKATLKRLGRRLVRSNSSILDDDWG